MTTTHNNIRKLFVVFLFLIAELIFGLYNDSSLYVLLGLFGGLVVGVLISILLFELSSYQPGMFKGE